MCSAFQRLEKVASAVKVVQVGDIALDRRHVFPDQRLRLVQLGLSPAGDKDIRAFGDELTPTASWFEYLDIAGAVLTEQLLPADGMVTARGPGLGLDWDEHAVARYAFS